MIAGTVTAAWLDAPLRRFVQDSRVQRAVVLRPDGKVLGQFGFQSATGIRLSELTAMRPWRSCRVISSRI
jgi:hypothetical protein